MATETQRHREWNEITEKIIGAAIEVHRELGPGLLKAVYEECLAWELRESSVSCERQKPIPVSYKGRTLDADYRIDLIVDAMVVVEVKAVDALHPVHFAQLLSYLVLTNSPLGLLINFNEAHLIEGVHRVANKNANLPRAESSSNRRSWIRTR